MDLISLMVQLREIHALCMSEVQVATLGRVHALAGDEFADAAPQHRQQVRVEPWIRLEPSDVAR